MQVGSVRARMEKERRALGVGELREEVERLEAANASASSSAARIADPTATAMAARAGEVVTVEVEGEAATALAPSAQETPDASLEATATNANPTSLLPSPMTKPASIRISPTRRLYLLPHGFRPADPTAKKPQIAPKPRTLRTRRNIARKAFDAEAVKFIANADHPTQRLLKPHIISRARKSYLRSQKKTLNRLVVVRAERAVLRQRAEREAEAARPRTEREAETIARRKERKASRKVEKRLEDLKAAGHKVTEKQKWHAERMAQTTNRQIKRRNQRKERKRLAGKRSIIDPN